MTIFEFKIGCFTDEEMPLLMSSEADAQVYKEEHLHDLLPDGEPKFKTVYARAKTEDEAVVKVDQYVRSTSYREIENKKVI